MKERKRKKSSFYRSSHREQQWTEEPTGRQIDFADKYAQTEGFSDKFDETRRKNNQLAQKKKEKRKRFITRAGAFVLAVILVGVGYTTMDIHMARQAKPAEDMLVQSNAQSSFSQIQLDLACLQVDGVTLDNSTMLMATIDDVHALGLNSVAFDAKRSDGTVGYDSSLATVDTFSGISNAGANSKGSFEMLNENDVLPVARLCVYLDNLAPNQDSDMALKNGNKVFKDKNGNTYLNPNSDEAYNYILDIVRELYTSGVKVFVLYGCDLPEGVGGKYNDGFRYISQRILTDLNNDVKLVEAVNVSINGADKESGKITNSAIKAEIKKLKKLDKNQVYYVSTKVGASRIYAQLTQNGVNNFILA